ncbi:MAG: substrate-binding domain-containing protein [Anderseniella sp.]|nr:substrate-binding domain-containing protein [Anderseniella sp.]
MRYPRSRKGAPGIVEVAARAGVSIATVSRTFSQPDMVRAPTRVRIEQAADDLGYIRNRAAGALHNRFSGTLGLVVPTIDNAIFAELIEAFSSRLRDFDRTMLIAAHGYDLDLEVAIVRSLLERRIDGIALVGFDHAAVSMNMLQQRDVPVISVWNFRNVSDIPCVGADNVAAARTVVRHVLDLGHRDIALLFPDVASNDRARDRMNGVMEELRLAGITVPPDRLISCPYDIGEAKRLVRDLVSGNGRPTAIVCGNDIIAHGAVYACYAEAVRIPDDISIVGIGDFRGSAHLEPGLTTIRMPARRIGRIAAGTLVEMSDTGMPPDPFSQKVEIELKDRGSAVRLHR